MSSLTHKPGKRNQKSKGSNGASGQTPAPFSQPGNGTHDLLQLQRQYGNRATQRLLAAAQGSTTPPPPTSRGDRSANVVQRMAVMSYEQWKKDSSRTGFERSEKLLLVDAALIRYHDATSKKPAVQRNALSRLLLAIKMWEQSKVDEDSDSLDIESRRLEDMIRLKSQAAAKMAELSQTPDSIDPTTPYKDQVNHVFDVYNRVRAGVQNIIAIAKPQAKDEAKRTMIERVAEIQAQLEGDAKYIAPYGNAMVDAGKALLAIAEFHLKVQVSTTGYASAAKAVFAHKKNMEDNIKQFETMSSIIKKEDREIIKAKLDLLAPELTTFIGFFKNLESEPDFDMPELYDPLMDLWDSSFNALGMQGTDGVGNEGIQEFYKKDVEGKSPEGIAKTIMSGLVPESSKGKDELSGVSDTFAGAGMAFNLGVEIGKLQAIIQHYGSKKDKESKRKVMWAKTRLFLLGTAGTTEAFGKIAGGMLTAHRGGGDLPDSGLFGKVKEDGSGAATGTDVSTDFKLAGDIAGVILSAVDSIKGVIDMVKKWIKRVDSEKEGGKSGKKRAQDAFNSVEDLAKSASNVGKVYSSVYKLQEQIRQGGQIVDNSKAVFSASKGTVSEVPVIPVLGLVVSVLDLIRSVARAINSGYYANKINKEMDSFANADTTNEGQLGALQLARESFSKRLNRALIAIGHAVAGVIAGATVVSGLGAGLSGLISIGKALASFTQIGVRKGKQYGRDRKGKEDGSDLTNLERGATPGARYNPDKEEDKAYAGQGQFVSYALYKAEKRIVGTGSNKGFNLDKSTANKEFRYRNAAMEILRSDEEKQQFFFEMLDIKHKIKAVEKDTDEDKLVSAKMQIVIDAFKRRE